MSVPNYANVPEKLFQTGFYNLKTHEGQHAFADAVVSTLNGLDANWRHLKKQPGQTQIAGHAEDAALYLFPDGTAQAVDFISGAGGPNPGPGWIVDTTVYTPADAHDPGDHGIGGSAPPPPPMPSYEALGGDEGAKQITRILEHDYRWAKRPGLDGDCGAWIRRTDYDFLSGKVTSVDASIDKHRDEWLAALGLIMDLPTGMMSHGKKCLICGATVAYEKTKPKPIPHASDCTTKEQP